MAILYYTQNGRRECKKKKPEKKEREPQTKDYIGRVYVRL